MLFEWSFGISAHAFLYSYHNYYGYFPVDGHYWSLLMRRTTVIAAPDHKEPRGCPSIYALTSTYLSDLCYITSPNGGFIYFLSKLSETLFLLHYCSFASDYIETLAA